MDLSRVRQYLELWPESILRLLRVESSVSNVHFNDEVGGVLFVIGSLGDNTFICKTILVILWCLCFVQ